VVGQTQAVEAEEVCEQTLLAQLLAVAVRQKHHFQ
jgi:hypothetical protein